MRFSPFFTLVSLATATLAASLTTGCYSTGNDCNLFNCGAGGSTTTTTTTTDTGSGTTGTGGSTPEGCVPADADGPVADGCGIFVRSTGADGNLGTKDSPLQTLSAAIEKAKDKGSRVYACAETFNQAVTAAVDVTIFGALDCESSWQYVGTTKRTTLTADADRVPLHLAAGVTVSAVDLDFIAVDAMAAGGSSIAIVAEDTSVLELTRSDITAGDGADGMSGGNVPGTATPGAEGPGGLASCTALEVHTPDAPVNECGDLTSVGGSGGLGGALIGGPGSPGQPGAENAGLGEGGAVCTDGTDGTDGADGEPGDGATGIGTLTTTGYSGVIGIDGKIGAPGQGGGGGGGAKGGTGAGKCASAAMSGGASGGAGGSGGCGGLGGTGGGPGGASIGIVSLGASLSFDEVKITTGKGALGGAGGAGQSGGFGGFGGIGGLPTGTLHAACNGGQGGKGGKGGSGGGGLGGHSIGIAHTGVAPDATGASIIVGTAGDGGPGDGVDMSTIGAKGTAKDIQEF